MALVTIAGKTLELASSVTVVTCCVAKHITYIYTYKTGLDQIVKLWTLLKIIEVNVIS